MADVLRTLLGIYSLSLQNLSIPSISSSFVLGFTIFLRKCFSSCQSISMGLRSGDSGGVFHQLMPLSSMKLLARRLVCFGSLSCWKGCPSGKVSRRNGSSPLLSISETKLRVHYALKRDQLCWPPSSIFRPKREL